MTIILIHIIISAVFFCLCIFDEVTSSGQLTPLKVFGILVASVLPLLNLICLISLIQHLWVKYQCSRL